MNDPHVVTLEYRIEHGPGIDWSRANPLDVQDDRFDIRVKDGRARFDLKEHYATEEEARASVEAHYIPNWEIDVGLKRGPDVFRLRFDRSEIVHRNPTPGPPTLSARTSFSVLTGRANLAPPTPTEFPVQPRAAVKRSPDVDSMFHRYLGHLDGREPLSGMANYCLTVLAHMARGHGQAPTYFCVSKEVLRRIGGLSANKGGANVRKACGRYLPYTPEEERFLKSAVKLLIRRAAELEHGPDPSRTQITLADVLRSPWQGTPQDQTYRNPLCGAPVRHRSVSQHNERLFPAYKALSGPRRIAPHRRRRDCLTPAPIVPAAAAGHAIRFRHDAVALG